MQLNIHEVLFIGGENCLYQLTVGNLWLSSSTAEKSKIEPWTEQKVTGFYCEEGKYCLDAQ